MKETKIAPEKINKPIQLLGAWLAGLFTVNSSFLFAATRMEGGSFESIVLVIASILNVPIFLAAVFLLQTKFRPELQEDHYYSTYLSQKTNEELKVPRSDVQLKEVLQKLNDLEGRAPGEDSKHSGDEVLDLDIGINKNLPDFDEIRKALSDQGVFSCTNFGSDELPRMRTVAIDHRVSKGARRQVLEAARKLGFSHWSYFDKFMEETQEDVLLGAYGEGDNEII